MIMEIFVPITLMLSGCGLVHDIPTTDNNVLLPGREHDATGDQDPAKDTCDSGYVSCKPDFNGDFHIGNII